MKTKGMLIHNKTANQIDYYENISRESFLDYINKNINKINNDNILILTPKDLIFRKISSDFDESDFYYHVNNEHNSIPFTNNESLYHESLYLKAIKIVKDELKTLSSINKYNLDFDSLMNKSDLLNIENNKIQYIYKFYKMFYFENNKMFFYSNFFTYFDIEFDTDFDLITKFYDVFFQQENLIKESELIKEYQSKMNYDSFNSTYLFYKFLPKIDKALLVIIEDGKKITYFDTVNIKNSDNENLINLIKNKLNYLFCEDKFNNILYQLYNKSIEKIIEDNKISGNF